MLERALIIFCVQEPVSFLEFLARLRRSFCVKLGTHRVGFLQRGELLDTQGEHPRVQLCQSAGRNVKRRRTAPTVGEFIGTSTNARAAETLGSRGYDEQSYCDRDGEKAHAANH